MEQLIIFLLLVVGSIISSIIQNKKKKAEEQQQRELEELTRTPRGQGHSQPPRMPARQPPHVPQSSQPSPAPEASWPRTAADWQEQLRRMLEGESAPPVFKPVLLPPEPGPPQKPPVIVTPPKQPVARERSQGPLVSTRPVRTSASTHERAANLQAAVKERKRALDEVKVKHTPVPTSTERARPRAHSAFVQRLKRNPRAIREAFIASIIFAPPQGLEQGATEPIR